MKGSSVLGKLLLLKNIITQENLNKALAKMKSPDDSRQLDRVLIEDFKVDEHKLYSEVSKLYAIQKKDIDQSELNKEKLDSIKKIIELLPKNLKNEAFEKKIIPYEIQKGRNKSLTILASNPIDPFSKKIIEALQINRSEVFYCPVTTVENIIERIREDNSEHLEILGEYDDQIDIDAIEEANTEKDEDLIEEEINKGALVYLFEAALQEGVRQGVSDVHIIPSSNSSVDIRYRVDGKLKLWRRKENVNPQAFLSVVKDRSSNVDRFKVDEAQDGFIQREIEGTTIRFRVSILPIVAKQHTKHFDSIVIRILDDRNVIDNIDDLGFLPRAKKDFLEATSKPQGLVIITGPTGSGKSTTLIGALYYLITPEINVLTVEDPVEYVIRGARQLKIGHKMSFDQAIRAILRHDPDVVLVGEIRDKMTAEVAMKLANTGHMTLSTLHTNDAPSAVSRLYKMGIEPFLIAYAINIIVAQRLLRRLCKHCKKPLSPEKHEYAISCNIDPEKLNRNEIYEANGCEKCRDSGYKGRAGIHEVLYFTPEIREEVLQSKDDVNEAKIRRIAEKNGMLNLRRSALELVNIGVTSLEEALSTTTGE